MSSVKVLPEHCLKLIAKRDREPLGKAGRTMGEIYEAADKKAELDLQGEIAGYLRLHEIEYIKPDGRKKSPLPAGWPDFTFAYRGVPVGMEVKTEKGALSSDQTSRHMAMRANGWRMVIVRSIPDVQALLRAIDAEIQPRVKL